MFPQAIVEGKVIFRESLNVREVFKHFFPRALLKRVFGSAMSWNWYSWGEVKKGGWSLNVKQLTWSLIEKKKSILKNKAGVIEEIKIWLLLLSRILRYSICTQRCSPTAVLCPHFSTWWHSWAACSGCLPVLSVFHQFHHLSCRKCYSAKSNKDFNQSTFKKMVNFSACWLVEFVLMTKYFAQFVSRAVYGLKPHCKMWKFIWKHFMSGKCS